MTITYRKQENSSNIAQMIKTRIKSIDNDISFKKMGQIPPIQILLMLDCLEILFSLFIRHKITDLKQKVEDFENKIQDQCYDRSDSCYFLARMYTFQENHPDLQNKVSLVIKKYRELLVQQETMTNRYQDLTSQVSFFIFFSMNNYLRFFI